MRGELIMDKEVLVSINGQNITKKDMEVVMSNIEISTNKKIETIEEKDKILKGMVITELLAQYAKNNKLDESEECIIEKKYAEKEFLSKLVMKAVTEKVILDDSFKVSEKEIEIYLEKRKDSVKEIRKNLIREMKNFNIDEKNKEIYLNNKVKEYLKNTIMNNKISLIYGKFIEKLKDEANIEYK